MMRIYLRDYQTSDLQHTDDYQRTVRMTLEVYRDGDLDYELSILNGNKFSIETRLEVLKHLYKDDIEFIRDERKCVDALNEKFSELTFNGKGK